MREKPFRQECELCKYPNKCSCSVLNKHWEEWESYHTEQVKALMQTIVDLEGKFINCMNILIPDRDRQIDSLKAENANLEKEFNNLDSVCERSQSSWNKTIIRNKELLEESAELRKVV